MRIIVDLQAAQTESSRNRGIGRYSMALLKAMAARPRGHELHVVLNRHFSDSVEAIREELAPLISQDNIHVWSPASTLRPAAQPLGARGQADELLREAFVASLQPDVVHITSLFEGLGDVASGSIGRFSLRFKTAVTLYDLIPFIHRKLYLPDASVARWYLSKAAHLRRADLLLGISESARREAVKYLDIPDQRTVNISSDVDPVFHVQEVSADAEVLLRNTYELDRPFVMYTGGIDHRKNIEGLIRAFARLPIEIKAGLQLAVVCSASPESRVALEALARSEGLSDGDLVMTGFVPESDLVMLYNLCQLFVFPSWHEGFGLPALEAMRCGAPVIAANTSSLPEVVGREDALFDPHDDASITSKLDQVLRDSAFRMELARHGLEQAGRFSWADSARRTFEAFERLVEDGTPSALHCIPAQRPRMAFISPLPTAGSGIADYSAQLLPDLSRYYEIVAISAQPEVRDVDVLACCEVRDVAWFEANASRFDRIVYQFGNSHFHEHMFGLLQRFPGVVVLHDFFLSGIQAFRTVHAGDPSAWSNCLYRSHGYPAVVADVEAKDAMVAMYGYPCNYDVLHGAVGTIVHSAHAVALARHWYGDGVPRGMAVIPLVRSLQRAATRAVARRALGIGEDEILVCSFGHIGAPKQSLRLLETWMASSLANDPRCRLVFVGDNPGGDYGAEMVRALEEAPATSRVMVSGWTDAETFGMYLAATDIAVQLRTLSRGETSAAVLDSMGHGVATIVNANGSMADLPAGSVCMLPDDFTDDQLQVALETLAVDPERRGELGRVARELVMSKHAPAHCAEQYATSIEAFYEAGRESPRALERAAADVLRDTQASDEDFVAVADAIAATLPGPGPARQLLLDVTGWEDGQRREVLCAAAAPLLRDPPVGFRTEPVQVDADGTCRYARGFAAVALNLDPARLPPDEVVELRRGDVCLMASGQAPSEQQTAFFTRLKQMGIKVEASGEVQFLPPPGSPTVSLYV